MQSTKGVGRGTVLLMLLVKESFYVELKYLTETNYAHSIDVQGDQFGCLRHKQIKLVDAYRTLLVKATSVSSFC